MELLAPRASKYLFDQYQHLDCRQQLAALFHIPYIIYSKDEGSSNVFCSSDGGFGLHVSLICWKILEHWVRIEYSTVVVGTLDEVARPQSSVTWCLTFEDAF